MGFLDNIQVMFGKKQIDEKPAVPAQNQQKKKILIVEDEKLLANALELKFLHENFEVFKAENGQIGLEMAQAHNPDIILLDLMMPVMDGKTMLHQLRQIAQFKYTPVIVLTNAGEIDNVRETKFYDNASEFLIKANVNPDDIVKVVNELI